MPIPPPRPDPDQTSTSSGRRNRLREIEPPAFRSARKGRGARANPTGRFERRTVIPDLDSEPGIPDEVDGDNPNHNDRDKSCGNSCGESDYGTSGDDPASQAFVATVREPALKTQLLPDPSRSAIVTNRSPDIPFEASLNPYRGCEHGCAYCYARPTHEYLGYSAGLDFETKILMKERAPELIRKELSARRWKPKVVALSGVTDAYQPVERRLELTRRCIEVFVEFRNPITIITKSALVTRDIDLLRQLAEDNAVSVSLSITTLDRELQRTLEPRASAPHERLRAVEKLAEAGIPTAVMVAPIIPGLTDAETPAILEAAAAAGASRAGHIVLRLPHGMKELFDDWLLTHRPLRREKVLHRLESLRGGKLYDARFGHRMRGEGVFANQIGDVFRLWARKHGLDKPHPALSTAAFRSPGGCQLELLLK